MERPRIVCLCGSTRFKQEFEQANRNETLAGRIVLTVGMFGHIHRTTMIQDGCMGPQEVEVEVVRDNLSITDEQKKRLDELHLRKIDLADEVLVINPGGYIGESTRREIGYAGQQKKPVRYLF